MDAEAQYEMLMDIKNGINACEGINESKIDESTHTGELVAEIHSHLGNIVHLIEDSRAAANGAEQFIELKSAQKELDGLSESLLYASENDLVGNDIFQSLRNKILKLEELISDTTDPEYS